MKGGEREEYARGVPAGALPAVVNWVPESDFARAQALWADYGEEWEGVDHAQYCRAMDARLRNFGPAYDLWLVPIEVSEFEAWCARSGNDSADPDSRMGYASVAAEHGAGRPWPPGDAEPCWCGRPNRYTDCCKAA